MSRLVFVAATKEKMESHGVNTKGLTQLTDGRVMFHKEKLIYMNSPEYEEMFNDPNVKLLTPEEYKPLLPDTGGE